MKSLHLLFAAKLIALAGLGGFMYANHQAKAEDSKESPAAAGKDSESSGKLPEIPENGLTLSRAAEIRNQLLLMRKDVEQKIEKLNVARQGYDRSKGEVESKLKRIEEERKLLEETLQKERKAKDERLSETLEFISKMEPKKAAPLIETMDRDLVMQLLRKLPPRQVTKLLESVNPKKATEILEYYTRIRSGREYELLREMGLCATDTEEGTNDKSKTDKPGPTGQTPGTAPIPVAADSGQAAAKAKEPGADTAPPAETGSAAAKSKEPGGEPASDTKEASAAGAAATPAAVVR
ncbi:MAG: hypothetical protein FJY29_12750 [Betaproteobacteria bacterium]|nr:hypothetical protein [Betaproteobacteria bacterium]